MESGQPHILNKTREVVALHKDRQMFPLSLCVARLSGAGMDSLFIGVMRHVPGSLDSQTVKVCCAGAVRDCLPAPANSMQPFTVVMVVWKCWLQITHPSL